MPIREKNSGLAYLRRSSDEQPNSLETQVQWASKAARDEDVAFEGKEADVQNAVRCGRSSAKSLRLDTVTGADLARPGLQLFIKDAINDVNISHVFIWKRDRLARPDNPLEAMAIEQKLIAAGITIIYSDRRFAPSVSGEVDLSASIMSLVDFHESGQFLIAHAERVLLTKRRLAEQGFWTGGRAPYGFERALRKPDGSTELLAPGRRVRQSGCHVIIVPHHMEKVAVWLRILDWSDDEWGNARIADQLNKEGIPSPGAGRIRRDHGVTHRVSGKWYPNTVKHLIENRAILGILDFGRRSEGRHRRLGSDGTRPVGDEDRRDGRIVRTVRNDPSHVISAKLPHEPLYDMAKWERIQEKQAKRGAKQRGIPRSRDLGRYPLSGRAIDLTDGCGHPLYGRMHGKRSILVCGRYMKSNGGECYNNHLDSEAALTFVLSTLRQIIAMHGGRDRIEEMLRAKALDARNSPRAEAHTNAVLNLERNLADYDEQIATATRRLATVDDDLVADVSMALRELKDERVRIKRRLDEGRRNAPQSSYDPDIEVAAAMNLLEQLESAMTDQPARRRLTALLRKLNVWLGIEFKECIKGKKRRVRKPKCGVLVFDENDLPVPPFGKDYVAGDGDSASDACSSDATDRSSITEKTVENEDTIMENAACNGVGGSFESRQEGISFTKVIRGDRI